MCELLLNPDSLNEAVTAKLHAFEEILKKWNKNINLVSPGNISRIWIRHIVDSLQITPFIESASKLADMGTGIGLPSIPVAIACPSLNLFAIEPYHKKAVLLSEVIRTLSIPNVHVLSEKAETVVVSHMDIVCCRAFGEFMRDANLAYKMLKPGGSFITFKSAPENRVPGGFKEVRNHKYLLPEYNKEFFVVIAKKLYELE